MSQPSSRSASIVVHLLDPAYQRPAKSWRFSDKSLVTIGRGDDCDVELNDPYVSRLHVELLWNEEGWSLVSRGRNGVTIHGKPVEQSPLLSGEVFRLGTSGPLLKFELATALNAASSDNPATLCFDTAQVGIFLLDPAKIDREVKEIAEGDYFQTLQKKARDLRRQRDTQQD